MTKVLGIDYGRRKIGVSLGDSESRLAEPLTVIRFENEEESITKIRQILQAQSVEQIVLGVSEGKMAEDSREFGKKLENKLAVPVIFQDETLTTQEAQKFSIEAGIKRKKRKVMEDAYSAALILQSYLDDLLK